MVKISAPVLCIGPVTSVESCQYRELSLVITSCTNALIRDRSHVTSHNGGGLVVLNL